LPSWQILEWLPSAQINSFQEKGVGNRQGRLFYFLPRHWSAQMALKTTLSPRNITSLTQNVFSVSFCDNSMGRMHAPGKGISKSARPYKRTPPSWCKASAADVEEQVCMYAKKGLNPSQIGVLLRDQNGIPQVSSITGQKVVRILKANGLAPDIPEDLYMLIKKAVQVRKHLERNRKDKDSKFRLILIESRIHRLARYYRTTRKLPANWKYESATASTMVA
jgi:small subunit ribosomal protein S13e